MRQDSVMETRAAVYAQNETQWKWLERSPVSASTAIVSALMQAIPRTAGRDMSVLPAQGGVVIGIQGHRVLRQRRMRVPQQRRAATITRDPVMAKPSIRRRHSCAARVPKLASGRSRAAPAILPSGRSLASELVFAGDAGTTEAEVAQVIGAASVRELLLAAALAHLRRRRLVVECAFPIPLRWAITFRVRWNRCVSRCDGR